MKLSNFYFNDEEIELLLKTLAEKHIILYMQNKNNDDIEKLVQIIAAVLEEDGKMNIMDKVFQEVKP